MKMKTWLTALAIAVLTAGLLAGCSGGGDSLSDVPADGQPMEPGMTAPEAGAEETTTPEASEETAAPEEGAAPEAETLPAPSE